MDKDKPINKVCHDTFELHARLFDHRPFLNGEILQFLREFEEKRGNRNIESLLKNREKLTDLQDSLNGLNGESIKATLAQFSDIIQQSTETVDLVCSKAERKVFDVESRDKVRQRKWEKFLDDNTSKLQAVDNFVKDQELDLRKHYEHLEQKLKLGH